MMVQNIKTDIIYYKTNTDFELEFSICGCCRMRLLTDKVADTKNLIPSMARAVSRSRIILIIGNLFGNDGILSLAAKAISKELAVINNSDFGIEDDSEIKIIDGATPLVSPQGVFGGCIIESGPQTLILLTENKSVRKSIMNTLIHPYITELAAQLYKETAEKKTETANQSSQTEAEPILETTEDITADEIPAEPIETAEEETEAKDYKDDRDIVFAPIEYPEDEDLADDYVEEYSARPYKKSSKSNVFMLITTILLFVAIAVFCYAVLYVPTQNGVTPSEYLREIFSTLFG